MRLFSLDALSYIVANKVRKNCDYGIYLSQSSPYILADREGTPNLIDSCNTGIYCNIGSTPYVRQVKIKNCWTYGVLIESETAVPNFGTAWPNNPGGSTIKYEPASVPPYYRDMRVSLMSVTVPAIGNFWGENPPNQFQIQGPIDYSNPLTSDPLYLFEKRESGWAALPSDMELAQNYPNPFNPTTKISFYLTQSGLTNLRIYSVMGQLVKTLISDNLSVGEHQVIWDGKNSLGADVASGIYFCVLSTDFGQSIKRMTLLR